MTALLAVLGWLLSLPLAVYTLAAVFELIDLPSKSRAVVDLSVRIVLVCALVAMMPKGTRWLVAVSFLLVGLLHAAAFLALRRAVLSGRWIANRYE